MGSCSAIRGPGSRMPTMPLDANHRGGSKMPAYYQSEDLPKLADLSLGAPGLWEKFQSWYGDVFEDGALSPREKALIALAVSNALQCPYCIDVYTRSSLENGSNLEQMTEAI